ISKVTETTTDENGTQSVKDKLYTDEQSQEKRFEIKYVSGLARINDYSSDAYVAKPTLKYSRDVLQLYYNYEFGPSSEFYKQLGSDVSEFLKSKIDTIQDKTIVG
ncbi:membrane protein insertase YidC, partial [Mycoplasmopsis synoviae]